MILVGYLILFVLKKNGSGSNILKSYLVWIDVLNVQFIKRVTPFTFFSRLNQTYTTVLSLFLALSTFYHFFSVKKH